MTLTALAHALGLDPMEASDRLWHLGIIAEPATDLVGGQLSAARDYLATIAVQQRPAAPAPDANRTELPAAAENGLASEAQKVNAVDAAEQAKATQGRTLNVPCPAGDHRVFELSQATAIPTEAIISAAIQLGIDADHVTKLTAGDIQAIWVALADTDLDGVTEKRVARGVKRRRKVVS